jgi:hypothetical protein
VQPKMKSAILGMCLVCLLFGRQAVGPCRTDTACAPMAAYTWAVWTPSRNPPARIQPVPSDLNKTRLLHRTWHCFRSLFPHLGRVRFWMVFIGNPRSETNMGEGDRIVLRSSPNYLRLLHNWSIMSTKIEVEMVVGRVVIPIIIQYVTAV